MVTATLKEKYQQEREKRIKIEGLSQYLPSSKGSLYALDVDPWIESGTPVHQPVQDGGHAKIVIFGAGFGGICAAIRCLESGAASSLDDVLIVDPAGGFGGTWWWNRFPGLMCDIESYIYLPMLEETGYMPKRKYAGGEEIRAYADLLTDKYNLRGRALFQTSGKSLTWSTDHWSCNLLTKQKGQPEKLLEITANFIILASGTFTYPKLPNLPGLDSFKGKMIHTARWNYAITGGAPALTGAALTGLTGKKVALVGTGATAIQVVPNIAKHAGELYVFQRTPSAVDVRNNQETDPDEWKTKIANQKGWQIERGENFQAFTENAEDRPKEDLVDDGWTNMPTISGAYGGNVTYSMEQMEQFVEDMQKQDAIRSERVRKRAQEVVKDSETAKNLQAWYPGWCKRPCFHDEYLPAFNQSNVHLIDTEGKGVTDLTPNGIVANDKEYPVDIIIWGTGYGSPFGSMAEKAAMDVIGRDSLNFDKRFNEGDLMTLHGIIPHNFPNLFSLGLSQAGVGVNQTQRMDEQSMHVAYTIAEAERKSGGKKVVIEPTEAVCEQWGDQVASKAYLLASMGGCTPSYFTQEAAIERHSPEQQMKSARSAIYGQGYATYAKILHDWRAKGDLEGLKLLLHNGNDVARPSSFVADAGPAYLQCPC